MKILLVNNNTRHLKDLNRALEGHEVETVFYKPGVDFHWQDKDLIVLSGGGGEGFEINDYFNHGKLWYDDEMKLVLECQKPIVGICMGFEVITRAYGSKVEEMSSLIKGYKHLKTTGVGKKSFDRDSLKQYEAHLWHVQDVSSKEFEVLAESETGIEVIRHKRRPILATQFHPEKPAGTLSLPKLSQLTFGLGNS
jgi:GMP synthase-like glutamine amidotransferase